MGQRQVLRALRVAEQAEAWLAQGAEGQVHSTFARACNLSWGGWLISLVVPEYGMVPGGIAVAPPGPAAGWGFRPGEPVRWDAARRRLAGESTVVDLSAAARWAGRGPLPAVASLDSQRPRAAVMATVVRECGRGELASLLAAFPPVWPVERDPGRWSSFAWSPLESLLRAAAAGDTAGVAAALPRLVGLGEGLTPSCDDFLLGVLAVQHYGRGALTRQQAACAEFMAAEAARLSIGTTPVSANYLRLAAGGGFSERLEAAALALLSADDGAETPQRAALNLMETGHSSGTDSLVGVILGATFILIGHEG